MATSEYLQPQTTYIMYFEKHGFDYSSKFPFETSIIIICFIMLTDILCSNSLTISIRRKKCEFDNNETFSDQVRLNQYIRTLI
jgi:hypothetical protein